MNKSREYRRRLKERIENVSNSAYNGDLRLNVFCATGIGGGVDPGCKLDEGGSRSTTTSIEADKNDHGTLRFKNEDDRENLREFLGLKALHTGTLARAVGGIKGSRVTVDFVNKKEVQIRVESQDFNGIRIFMKDKNGDPYCYNHQLEVHDTGKGLGTRILANQVDALRELGFKKMECYAAGSLTDSAFNGYWTWPRLGYDGPLPKGIKFTLLNSGVPNSVAKATKVSDLLKTERGAEWWKENGTGFHATFDLKDGSHSMKVFKAYLKAKNKKSSK